MPPAAVKPSSTPNLSSPALNAGARPYRSHKVRACDLCRKRKSRCTVDIPGQSCLLCRVQGADCHYQEEELAASHAPEPAVWHSDSAGESSHPGQKRKRTSETVSPLQPSRRVNSMSDSHRSDSAVRPRRGSDPGRQVEDPQNESVFIVGPVVADDANVIEKHMPPRQSNRSVEPKNQPYNVYSNDPRKPILYQTVSRRRQGMRVGIPPGENQKEILEQILGPFKDDLVKLYAYRVTHYAVLMSKLQVPRSFQCSIPHLRRRGILGSVHFGLA